MTMILIKTVLFTVACICGGTTSVAFKLGDFAWGCFFASGTFACSLLWNSIGA
jgi:hypothetical protein